MLETQETIGTWADATFNHTSGGIVLHLLSEAVELCMAEGCTYDSMRSVFEDAVSRRKPDTSGRVEAADVTVLARAYAHHEGFDLEDEVSQKMAINRARAWGKPNELGITEHVRA